jgi:diguanylate cyclase (GGDEF)-like protein/PAS domain S-box-containing protein
VISRAQSVAAYRWVGVIALLGLLLSIVAYRASSESLAVLTAGCLFSTLIGLFLTLLIRQDARRVELVESLAESEERFRQLADNIDAVFWISTPDWQQVIYISPAYERIWGRTTASVYQRGMDWFDAVVEEDRTALREKLPTKAGSDWQTIEFPPYRIRRPDGCIRWILAHAYPVRDERGRIVRVAGIAEDITERQSYQQDLEDLAHFDPLTHLPNRRLLADRMRLALARSQRTGQLLAVCMLDLDGFKPVNDKYGHEVGDQLLIEVARRLLESVRGDDTVARLGGDEFVILLGGLNHMKELDEALARLLHIVASPYALVDQGITVSASIGVTLSPSDQGDADTLLRHADHAMYQAKEAGKNRYHLFNPVLEERERDNRTALGLIKKAVTDDQLRLFYQPIVDCRRGLVVGMEALVRWEHPILGLMGPAEFLPLVDGDDNLARSVGTWVLRHAIQQAEDWRQEGLDIPVSINVFVQQLRDPRFPELLQDLLAEYPDLPANRVCIEILESTALDDFASVIRLIRTCASQGVRFALDDFGTGFSSLTYLRRLPVNTLKIDQSFVRDMLQDPDDLTIVEGVVGLSTAFRHQVIAEGVESADHALMLMEMGCYLVQGFGIAKPMPGGETRDWIAHFKPDPRWLENAAQRLSRDDFQLVLAEVNHRQWLTSLQNWMRQDPAHRGLSPPLNGHECNFGHWYYGEGSARYGHLREYRDAEALHERIHRLAQQLVRQAEYGEVAASRESEAELIGVADEFRDTLTRIRTAVKYADAGQ